LSPNPVRSANVEVIEVGGELLIVDEHHGTAFALDPVASFLWDGLSAGVEVSTLVDELAAQFDVPVEVIATDVAWVIEQFVMFNVMSIDGPTLDEDGDDSQPEQVVLSLSPPDAPTFDERYLAALPNY
jgi:hypothetical protein